MATSAFVVPTNACNFPGGTATQFVIQFTCIVQDGSTQGGTGFGQDFVYDSSQTAAVQLAAFKAFVAAEALSITGIAVDVSNILIFTAVN